MPARTVRRRLHAVRRCLAGMIWLPLVAAALLLQPMGGACAGQGLRTNEGYVNDVLRAGPLDVTDLMAVFRAVYSALPDTVTVYPTENYYYFTFFNEGIEYAGNFRLDASDRDDGVFHFAYFTAYAPWNQELVSDYKALTAQDGVSLERLGNLAYRATFDGKSVTFALNDLTHVRPPPGGLAPDEIYLGPVFDESGIEMFLVFNKTLNIFHYVLNETGSVADILMPGEISDRILIGHRTGFAYFSDHLRNRKILIGVFNGNSVVNNYFDGPFDQLPDNFIEGDELRDALEAAFPSVKGKIDRFGNAEGGQTRILITPYMHYDSQYELQYFADCAEAMLEDESAYYACFSVEEDEESEPEASDGDGGEDRQQQSSPTEEDQN
jgi:hypothetical protein